MPKKYSIVLFSDENIELEVLTKDKDLIVVKDTEGRIHRVRVLRESDERYVLYIDDKITSVGIVGDKIYVDLQPILVKKVKEHVSPVKVEEGKEEKQIQVEEGVVVAPISGKIIEVKVMQGQEVGENDVIAVLESMKMLIEVKSPFKGVVEAVYVKPGVSISKGDKLVKVKPVK
jgi:biotin carboxyl carrier protein